MLLACTVSTTPHGQNTLATEKSLLIGKEAKLFTDFLILLLCSLSHLTDV